MEVLRSLPEDQIGKPQEIDTPRENRRMKVNSKASKGQKSAHIFLALILGAVGAIPLVFLTPPFQVPDEVAHFYRAYELSEFRIRAEVQNGVAGATLPDSLPQLVKSSVYTPDGIYFPVAPTPIAKTLKLASIPLNSSTREFVAFPGSAFYSPLPYVPQVLGISVGRAIGLGPLYLFYLGRVFNCLAALMLIGLAVNSMPYADELVILVGLLPMSLFLYASISPDASVIGCALVFTALSFSANARGDWRPWELVVGALAAAVFCSVKPVYFPILLAGIVPGLFRPDKAAKVIRSHAILITVAVGVTSSWLLFARSTMTSPVSGGHPSIQTSLVLHHPMIMINAIVNSLGIKEVLLSYFQTVGEFGCLTVPLRPIVAYLLPLGIFAIVWRQGRRNISERYAMQALWHLALALTSALLVMAAMYFMYAQVGQDKVTGVQGRYFIPILVLAGMAAIELTPRSNRPVSWRSLACITILIVAEIVAMDTTIVGAFHAI